MTPEQQKVYLGNRGLFCPYCESGDIVGDSVEIEAGEAYQSIDCNNCNASWLDQYTLTGITLVNEPTTLESPCAGCGKTPQTCTCKPDPWNVAVDDFRLDDDAAKLATGQLEKLGLL